MTLSRYGYGIADQGATAFDVVRPQPAPPIRTIGPVQQVQVIPPGNVTSDLIPNNDDAFNLGTAAKRWKTLRCTGVVVGVDPGTAEPLRVAGAARITGTLQLGTTGTVTLTNAGDVLALTGSAGVTLFAQGLNPIKLSTNALDRWVVQSAGHLVPGATGAYDLGQPGASVRTGYFGTVIVGTDPGTSRELRVGGTMYVASSATGQLVRLRNSVAPANQKEWAVTVSGSGILQFQPLDDGGVTQATVFEIDRLGTVGSLSGTANLSLKSGGILSLESSSSGGGSLQLKAPSGASTEFRFGGLVRMKVDDTFAAEAIALLVYDWSFGGLKWVSRGPADSGGTGFRLLRIPN